MEIFVGVLLGLALGGALAVALVRSRLPGEGQALAQLAGVHDELTRLAERVASDSVRLGGRLEGIDDRMVRTHASNAGMASDIFETLGDVRRATTIVAEQAREFSSLQDLLRAPTARGGLGEAMLEELLRQVLPPGSFSTQHRFTSGVVVDAVVRAGGKIACIDAKFPLLSSTGRCNTGHGSVSIGRWLIGTDGTTGVDGRAEEGVVGAVEGWGVAQRYRQGAQQTARLNPRGRCIKRGVRPRGKTPLA